MPSDSSRNFIVITLAVLVLGISLPPQHKLRTAQIGLISRVNYPESKPQHHVFGDLAEVLEIFQVHLTGPGKPEKLMAGAVATNFFQTIGVEPFMGRAFLTGEDLRGRDHVVILSHRLWLQKFKGTPAVVGRSIQLEGDRYQVIGILPADFSWNNRETDIWLPCPSGPEAGTIQHSSQAVLVAEV